MATRINLTVAQESLLARDGIQRQASRTLLTRIEGEKKVQARATQKRQAKLAASSLDATAATTSLGGGSASIFPDYTPSLTANRFVSGDILGIWGAKDARGEFYIQNTTYYTTWPYPVAGSTGDIPAYYQKPLVGYKIKGLVALRTAEFKDLSVIVISGGNNIVPYTMDSYFDGAAGLADLVRFVTRGGILVIIDEYYDSAVTGTEAEPGGYIAYNEGVLKKNADISAAFKTSINQITFTDPGSNYGTLGIIVDEQATLVEYIDPGVPPDPPRALGSIMPSKCLVYNTGIYSGGNTLYVDYFGRNVASWQTVGSGVLIRAGDPGDFGVTSTWDAFQHRSQYAHYYTQSGSYQDWLNSLTAYEYYHKTSTGLGTSMGESLIKWQKSSIR